MANAILQFRRGGSIVNDLTISEPFYYETDDTFHIGSDGFGGYTTLVKLNDVNSGSLSLSGNITASNGFFTNDVIIDADLYVNGTFYLGNEATDEVKIIASLSGSLTPTTGSVFNIGTPTYTYNTIYADNAIIGNITSSLDYGNLTNVPTLVSGSSQINHDLTTNFVSDEHINHSTLSITAGNGLAGGGVLTSTRSLTLDTGSLHFTNGIQENLPSNVAYTNVDNNFTTSQTISGDVTVTGILTAQEFHTEFISSSIIYESGSTKFGDTADDTHEFTGSLNVSGSVTVSTGSFSVYSPNNEMASFASHNQAGSAGAKLSIKSTYEGRPSLIPQYANGTEGSAIVLLSSTSQYIHIVDANRKIQPNNTGLAGAGTYLTFETPNGIQIRPSGLASWSGLEIGGSTGQLYNYLTIKNVSNSTLVAVNKDGVLISNKIDLNKAGGASGLSFYSSANTAWQMYTSTIGAGAGNGGNITAPAGTLVKHWALRSFVENADGYGWTFESATLNSTSPTVVAEIRSNDGSARFGPLTSSYLEVNQDANFGGDVTVAGTITAQEFHTEFISSSIIYESGSTKFGDSADDTHQFTGSVSIQGTLDIDTAQLSYSENLDVDSASTEVIATVPTGSYDSSFFDYVVKNGTNLRAGIVMAVHDGTSVEYTDTTTTDLGDTTPVSMSVDLSGGNMRLLATTSTDNWIIKTLIRSL